MRLPFTKMQGAGNDFVVLDATRAPLELSPPQLQRLADRRFGVGADQILVVEPSRTPGVDFRYRIFNGFSGAEVEHCGNGARCFVRYVRDKGLTDKTSVRVETVNNLLELHAAARRSRHGGHERRCSRPSACRSTPPACPSRDAGAFELWPLDVGGRTLHVAVLSMGNPHAVLRVDDVRSAPVAELGPAIETHPRFPRRSTPASCRWCRAARSRCACTSATPAKRWPAAPAPVRPWWPASAWAGSTRGWTCRRAAGCSPSNGTPGRPTTGTCS
jgi:diaminopimelate epimerase